MDVHVNGGSGDCVGKWPRCLNGTDKGGRGTELGSAPLMECTLQPRDLGGKKVSGRLKKSETKKGDMWENLDMPN